MWDCIKTSPSRWKRIEASSRVPSPGTGRCVEGERFTHTRYWMRIVASVLYRVIAAWIYIYISISIYKNNNNKSSRLNVRSTETLQSDLISRLTEIYVRCVRSFIHGALASRRKVRRGFRGGWGGWGCASWGSGRAKGSALSASLFLLYEKENGSTDDISRVLIVSPCFVTFRSLFVSCAEDMVVSKKKIMNV